MAEDQKQESPERAQLQQLIVAEAVRRVRAVNFVELIEDQVDKCIKSAVTDLFSYSGPVAKQIKAAVSAAGVMENEQDLGRFTVAVRETVKAKLNNIAEKSAAASVGEMLDKLLPPSCVIKLSELRSLFKQKMASDYAEEMDDEDFEHDESEYTWKIAESASSKGYWDLTIAEEPDATTWSKGTIFLRFSPCTDSDALCSCWNSYFGGDEHALKGIFAGPLYGFDAAVWRLASGVSKLERDC